MPDNIQVDTVTDDDAEGWAVAVHPTATGVAALVFPMVGDDNVDASHPIPCTIVGP